MSTSPKSRRRLFQSRQARQSFWLLFVGVVFILGAGMSIFSTYLIYGRSRASQFRVANDVVRAISVARTVNVADLPKLVHFLNGNGVRVSLSDMPPTSAQILQLTDPTSVRRYVLQHSHRLFVSVPLANGQWLTIRAHHIKHQWLLAGLISSSVVLFFALISLCVWIIKRLDLPLRAFSRATKRFGVDVLAPSLPLMGSPEVQEVIQAFNDMQDRIRRLLHDRTQMLAAISHDLRTPITRLQLRAEYLKDTQQYDKAVADLNEMETMISSILSFARDHVRSENMERFDINALLETLCADMIDMGQAVNYQTNLGRMPYFGRIGALKRAITNLVENAVKYGQKADVTLTKKGRGLQIKVSDDGPGVSSDQLEKVFAPFYRVDSSRSLQKSGTGLGLAVARDIIRSHGGEIVLYNRKPHGLSALVTLPIQAGD